MSQRIRMTRWGLIILTVMALLFSAVFGVRSYRTLVLLRSAQELGIAETSSIRGWMTLRYIGATYGVDEKRLIKKLELPPSIDRETTLWSLAEMRNISTFTYVQEVQTIIADRVEPKPTDGIADAKNGWLSTVADRFLSAVLVYGYPALGLTLFLGAVGAPVPTGLATTVAGSLASQGHMRWEWAIILAVGASVLGDVAGYGAGRLISGAFLERYGGWFGYTPANRARAEAMFTRWGAITVVLTRTLVSHLSSIVSILAGMSRFRFGTFLVLAIIGRIIWTVAYFELGFLVGKDLEAASGFLGNLSVFLLSIAAVVGASLALSRFGLLGSGPSR